MNKKIATLLSLLSLSLVACADTSELYPGNAYISGDFLLNRYNHYDAGTKEAPIERTIELVNDENAAGRYFCGSGNYDRIETVSGLGQLKSWHANAVGDLAWEPDINSAGIGVWSDQSGLVGKAFGATKKMSLINDKFARGYLSKLYNGQVRCNGWSSYSWVEIDESGYGTVFPAELNKADYFAMAVRGGSDLGPFRLSHFDINVTFLKEKTDKTLIGTTFALKDVRLQTNRSSNFVSLVGFYFNELGTDFDPNGIVGMSVTFTLEDEDFSVNPSLTREAREKAENAKVSTNFDDNEEYHMALIMMEVFFPDSTWY